MKVFVGIDSGSVSTKAAACNENGELLSFSYLRTGASPLEQAAEALELVLEELAVTSEVLGVCLTGSARKLLSEKYPDALIKNEITAQSRAAARVLPQAATVLEIGGQDSKIILMQDGLPVDFAMNTVCAAGTGSFLDHQATRLGIDINDFETLAEKSQNSVPIDARCTVFAESAMVSAQQSGASKEDIVKGLSQALADNFLNSVGAGKTLKAPYIFQGGVARNRAIVKALEEKLGEKITVFPNPHISGAYGASLCALAEYKSK